MKLLYIAFKDFSNLHFGANAKVLSQCRAFEEYPCSLHDSEYLGCNGMRYAVGKGSVGLPCSVPGKLDSAKGTAVL